MAMYAIATLPLIHQLDKDTTAQQIWYADDSSAAGSVHQTRSWWNKLKELGPMYGYFVNPNKSWLVVKEEHLEIAQSCFSDTDIQITTAGRSYLGSAIGERDFIETFVQQKVQQWESELLKLSQVAKSQPHSAYSALVHSMKNRYWETGHQRH